MKAGLTSALCCWAGLRYILVVASSQVCIDYTRDVTQWSESRTYQCFMLLGQAAVHFRGGVKSSLYLALLLLPGVSLLTTLFVRLWTNKIQKGVRELILRCGSERLPQTEATCNNTPIHQTEAAGHVRAKRQRISNSIVQELCERRGGRPGLSVLTSLLVSVDVKIYWTMLRHWSQLVPNMSTDIWGH